MRCDSRAWSPPFSNPNFESETHRRPRSRARSLALSKSQSDFEAPPFIHSESEVASTNEGELHCLSFSLSQPSLNPYQSDSEIHLRDLEIQLRDLEIQSDFISVISSQSVKDSDQSPPSAPSSAPSSTKRDGVPIPQASQHFGVSQSPNLADSSVLTPCSPM
ncbi:uncharacterized protein LOC114279572 isoform X3 [Camellia sinensis]|uniref:uncharacterized protein LOC114279572 isoform X3 n=1 Tax=Camellia sinensis TaxID=4442 RepID=UPI0010369F4C|nr:uncharacterized protein LOC114279572 isoform X3 [Camellia sinensis]